MKQWIEICHTQKKGQEGYIYGNVAGKKIAGPSKVSYEHLSETKVNMNDI